MIKELKIDLRQVENVLLYKVIQQDESYIGKGKIFENGDVDINSLASKAIVGRDLYINGVEECGNDLFITKMFASIAEATEIKDKIEKCVADFNAYIRKENEKGKYGFSCGEEYWFVTDHGVVHNSKWKNREADKFRYNSKNAFKTKEEAERKLEILNCIYENQTIFTEEQWEEAEYGGFELYSDVNEHSVGLCYNDCYKFSTYYFKDKETARKVADFIGYDDFMKYL